MTITAGFRRPFVEQVAALLLRFGTLAPTAKWDDLWQSQHDRAFIVAGVVKADILADLAEAVGKAIVEGRGFEAFQRDFRAIVEKRGWHGWTGEGTPKGELWRMRVIYRTNVATSYAAGRMAQLRDGKFKYWIYKHGNALEPRVQHLAWDGIALPPDHPFWLTHAPPNGWGCTCEIRGANTVAGIRRAKGDPDKKLPEGWQTRDPKTGAPPGIDRGWDYPVGGTVSQDILDLVKTKSEKLPEELAQALNEAIGKGRAGNVQG